MKLFILITLVFVNCFPHGLFIENFKAKEKALRNPCPNLGRVQDKKIVDDASFNDYTYIELSDHEIIYIERKYVDSVDKIDNTKTLSQYLEYYRQICKVDKPPFYNDISIVKKNFDLLNFNK